MPNSPKLQNNSKHLFFTQIICHCTGSSISIHIPLLLHPKEVLWIKVHVVMGVVIIAFVIVIIIVFVHPMVHLVVLRKRGRNTMKRKLTRTRSFWGMSETAPVASSESSVLCT